MEDEESLGFGVVEQAVEAEGNDAGAAQRPVAGETVDGRQRQRRLDFSGGGEVRRPAVRGVG